MRALPREFVGIDGEGVTDERTGEHRYVLLACGDSVLEEGGKHLDIVTIFDFLWDCFTDNPRAVYVGFYLKYDWGQWLKSLPYQRAQMLLTEAGVAARRYKVPGQGAMIDTSHLPPRPVEYAGWEFDYLVGKRFKLRPAGEPPRSAPSKLVSINTHPVTGVKTRHWQFMFICDAGSYFQCSFLRAVDPRGNPNPVVTADEFRALERGKERRATAKFDDDMIRYNRLECAALERLMAQLAAGMRQEGLKLRRDKWHGPGQLAQAWMNGLDPSPRAKPYKSAGASLPGVLDRVPAEVRAAAQASYFGGWFECFHHGPVPGESYSYDINSAYPHIMASLPCLLHGEWRHRAEREGGRRLTWAEKDELAAYCAAGGLALVRAAVRGRNNQVGAMQHRTSRGKILRPWETSGWYWAHELVAAIGAAFVEEVRLFEGWRLEAHCTCPPPVAPIAALYQGRIDIGKNTPAGKARKLVYNSCAGKFQQSVGQPAYGNAVYGSLITAGCRTIMAEAIASHPKGAPELLMVATDSVTFSTPHTGLPLSDRLGEWSETCHENLSLLRPGVYWDDAGRAKIEAGENPVFKSRGIPARDIARRIKTLDRAWDRFNYDGWPRLVLPIKFQLVSPMQAIDRKDWSQCGLVITDQLRMITSDPKDKRKAREPGRSTPWASVRGEPQSHPYDGTFGDDQRAWGDQDMGDHPDGPPEDLLKEGIME